MYEIGKGASGVIVAAAVGKDSLGALRDAVGEAQGDDPFAQVIVVADHPDAARSVRHWLGLAGSINVSVMGRQRLAGIVAAPLLGEPVEGKQRRMLTPLLESQAARRVIDDLQAEDGADGVIASFSAAGKRQLQRSLVDAFRRMREGRGQIEGDDDADVERLYERFRDMLGERADYYYYTSAELPDIAADALGTHWGAGGEPAVVYYLPRRMSEGDKRLALALLGRGKCRVIGGLVGDGDADKPVCELLSELGWDGASGDVGADPVGRLADAGNLSVIVAPDPGEEARAVIRRIAADSEREGLPFHRVAIVHPQAEPYASLLRQELKFADMPFAGVERRTLGDTLPGRLTLGIARLAADLGPEGEIERETLAEWLTNTPVANPDGAGGRAPVAATGWVELARNARANGGAAQWGGRLRAHIESLELRLRELNDGVESQARERPLAENLLMFVEGLGARLRGIADARDWKAASGLLKDAKGAYQARGGDGGRGGDDDRMIDEFIQELALLDDWDADYDAAALLAVAHEGLQRRASERGSPVGAGVYVGPPAGVAGAEYDAVYVVGMAERLFPTRPRTSSWLDVSAEDRQAEAGLQRYDFLAALAGAGRATLCCPGSVSGHRAAYPSRWLIEAANVVHAAHRGEGRLSYENLTADAEGKAWLAVARSREEGLRDAGAKGRVAADDADYRLTRLMDHPKAGLASHRAIAGDRRMVRALEARAAKWVRGLTEWDGLVGGDFGRVRAIGGKDRMLSPSQLETWAACPYRYFLGRVLGVQGAADEEEDEISPLERGSLVHKVLERFVEECNDSKEWIKAWILEAKERLLDMTEEEFSEAIQKFAETDRTSITGNGLLRNEHEQGLELLMKLADEEFGKAERRGITGYPLLWEMEKEQIRKGLDNFSRSGGLFQNTGDFGGHFFRKEHFRIREMRNLVGRTESMPVVRLPGCTESRPVVCDPCVRKLALIAYAESASESRAEVSFDELKVRVRGLGDVWLHGKIDRVDVSVRVEGFVSVKVRDFKAGKPDSYVGGNPAFTVGNGRALQMPVYWVAAKRMHPGAISVEASYCFPLATSYKNMHKVQNYSGTVEQQREFLAALRRIVGSARGGVFPATPESDSDVWGGTNCGSCDFNRLCPARRRQIWERKAGDARARAFNELGGKATIDAEGNDDGSA